NGPKTDDNSTGGAGGGPQSGQSAESQPEGVLVLDATGAEMKKTIKPEAKVSSTVDVEKKNEEETQGVEDVGKKKNGDMGTKEEEEEEEKKEDAATGTTNEMSAGTEEQPIVSSGAEGASNITNPKSTQTTGDDDPTADGAGTREEKQNENKDANPKETPVTATAMKTTTATTGDSDGSTAVSHTTSPPFASSCFCLCGCCCGGGRVRVMEGEPCTARTHTRLLSLSLCVCPLAWTLALTSPTRHTIMCPLYICMHTHAGPLVLSFARHAPLPSCLAAWAEHRNCFCFVFIALSGRPFSLSPSVCVFCFTGAMRVCALVVPRFGFLFCFPF
ncbi:hypothetical protein TCSYLVIO_008652, partial [Trypanosoma cruzi]